MRTVPQVYVSIYRCLSPAAINCLRYGFSLADGREFRLRFSPESRDPELYQGLVALKLLTLPPGQTEDVGRPVGGLIEHQYGFTRLGYEFAKGLIVPEKRES